MGHPGGGRTRITQRYIRYFNVLNFIPFDGNSLHTIFARISTWFLSRFSSSVRGRQGHESIVMRTDNVKIQWNLCQKSKLRWDQLPSSMPMRLNQQDKKNEMKLIRTPDASVLPDGTCLFSLPYGGKFSADPSSKNISCSSYSRKWPWIPRDNKRDVS